MKIRLADLTAESKVTRSRSYIFVKCGIDPVRDDQKVAFQKITKYFEDQWDAEWRPYLQTLLPYTRISETSKNLPSASHLDPGLSAWSKQNGFLHKIKAVQDPLCPKLETVFCCGAQPCTQTTLEEGLRCEIR